MAQQTTGGRTRTATAVTAALLLAACGPKALTLPDDPIDKAATCGVVTAAEARSTSNARAALPLEAQGRILHYALLGGLSDDGFSPEKASAVTRRMSDLQDDITSGDWQSLVPVCAAAYPATQVETVTLPVDRFDAALGCDEVSRFMTTALQGSEKDYGRAIASYYDLARTLDGVLAPDIRARAGASLEAQQKVRHTALARMATLGPPVPVLRQCLERFAR